MSIKIAAPDNPVYNELVHNSDELVKSGNIILYRVPESQCTDLLFSNRADMALLSPLSYSQGILNGDYRIVKGPVLAYSGFSGIASVYFREGISSIDSCTSPNPDDFIMKLGNMLLTERYGLGLSVKKSKGTKDEMLRDTDSLMIWEKDNVNESALDITEIWYDSFELPMVLGFWVCRAEDYPPDANEIVHRLWNSSLSTEEDITETKAGSESVYVREGKIFRQWNESIEDAIDKTIHLLYYHQIINEIAAVKILGRD